MPVSSLVRQHGLAAFFVGAIGLGSLATAVASLFPATRKLLPVVALPVSYVPAAAAVAVVHIADDPVARAALMRRVTTLGNDRRWYGVALVALPLVHVAGVGLAARGGGRLPVHARAATLLPLFLLTSAGEEVGWRGYALPALQERHGLFTAAVIVGLGWAAFHSADLLTNSDAPIAYVATSAFLFTGLSVIIAYVFDASDQAVPVAILMHAAYNTVSVGVMPLAETKTPLRALAMTAAVAWVAALGIAAARRGGDVEEA